MNLSKVTLSILSLGCLTLLTNGKLLWLGLDKGKQKSAIFSLGVSSSGIFSIIDLMAITLMLTNLYSVYTIPYASHLAS